jgi:protein-S-isoprenylcysteine O-methyltransferase Ste14
MRRAAQFAVFAEKYLLSVLYLYYGWVQFRVAWQGLGTAGFPSLANSLLMCAFQLGVGAALLLNRAPVRLPQNWKEIVLPLAGTYYYLLYNYAGLLPRILQQPLAPASTQTPLAAVALGLSFIGYAIALWGLLHLGRSFALLVSVRGIVTGGPYRYLRHPIYFGYLLHLGSLFLSRTSLGMLLLVAGHVLLTLCRARLEEARLIEHSEAYRAYAARTGFLWPSRRQRA